MTPKLTYLLLLMAVLIVPADYTKVKNPVKATCERQFAECGNFLPPVPDRGQYICRINKQTCVQSCQLKCPKTKDGKVMPISDKLNAKELYTCSAGSWKRRDTPRAYCMSNTPVKEVRQNFHHMEQVNGLIKTLFNTSYYYLAMASFYERADVDLPGFSKFMTGLWEKELHLARNFMSYVNKRGGYISLYDIPSPSSHEMLISKRSSQPGLVGMQAALDTLREVNEQALGLHKIATMNRKFSDPHLKFHLEDGILSEKVETIKKVAEIITRLASFSSEDYSLGEFKVDLELQE